MGGLGNQLFQIFATISYAIKAHVPFAFLNVESLGGGEGTTKRHTYWKSLFYKLKPFLKDSFPQLKYVRENGFQYNSFNTQFFMGNDACLHGYFQSYMYFQEYYKQIYSLLDIFKAICIFKNITNKYIVYSIFSKLYVFSRILQTNI